MLNSHSTVDEIVDDCRSGPPSVILTGNPSEPRKPSVTNWPVRLDVHLADTQGLNKVAIIAAVLVPYVSELDQRTGRFWFRVVGERDYQKAYEREAGRSYILDAATMAEEVYKDYMDYLAYHATLDTLVKREQDRKD